MLIYNKFVLIGPKTFIMYIYLNIYLKIEDKPSATRFHGYNKETKQHVELFYPKNIRFYAIYLRKHFRLEVLTSPNGSP